MNYKADLSRIKNSYKSLIMLGYKNNNAHERVVFENGHMPYDLVCYATGRYLGPEQLRAVNKLLTK